MHTEVCYGHLNWDMSVLFYIYFFQQINVLTMCMISCTSSFITEIQFSTTVHAVQHTLFWIWS